MVNSRRQRAHLKDPVPPPQPVVQPHQSVDYLAALRRRWLVVVAAAIVAAGVAYGISEHVLAQVYRSSATVIVNSQVQPVPADSPARSELFVDDQSLSETFEQLALQPAVRDEAARSLGMRSSRLASKIHVHAVPRTPLVVISFDASTPAEAARGARMYTAEFVQSTRRSVYLPGQVQIVSEATRPTEPIAPRPLLNTLVAGLAGLLLGLTVLLGREHLRTLDGGKNHPPSEEPRRRALLERPQGQPGANGFRATDPVGDLVEGEGEHGRRVRG